MGANISVWHVSVWHEAGTDLLCSRGGTDRRRSRLRIGVLSFSAGRAASRARFQSR